MTTSHSQNTHTWLHHLRTWFLPWPSLWSSLYSSTKITVHPELCWLPPHSHQLRGACHPRPTHQQLPWLPVTQSNRFKLLLTYEYLCTPPPLPKTLPHPPPPLCCLKPPHGYHQHRAADPGGLSLIAAAPTLTTPLGLPTEIYITLEKFTCTHWLLNYFFSIYVNHLWVSIRALQKCSALLLLYIYLLILISI